jgi:hypothetical protein
METLSSGRMDGSVSSNQRNAQGHIKALGQRGCHAHVDLGHMEYQVALLFSESDPLGDSLSQQCQGLTHSHVVVATAEEAWRRVSGTSRQTVLLVDISTNRIAVAERLVKLLGSQGLWWLQATLVGVVSEPSQ